MEPNPAAGKISSNVWIQLDWTLMATLPAILEYKNGIITLTHDENIVFEAPVNKIGFTPGHIVWGMGLRVAGRNFHIIFIKPDTLMYSVGLFGASRATKELARQTDYGTWKALLSRRAQIDAPIAEVKVGAETAKIAKAKRLSAQTMGVILGILATYLLVFGTLGQFTPYTWIKTVARILVIPMTLGLLGYMYANWEKIKNITQAHTSDHSVSSVDYSNRKADNAPFMFSIWYRRFPPALAGTIGALIVLGIVVIIVVARLN